MSEAGSIRPAPAAVQDRSMRRGGGTPERWRVLGATFMTYLVDSYDLIVLAIAMPVLLEVLNISLPEGGLLGSATMVGAMLGSVVFGLVADNHGRRFAVVTALVWLGVGMGFVYFIHSWGEWMLLRLVTGLAIGGIWGPCAALIADHWAPEYRARAASFMLSSFAVGAVLASLVGRLVLYVDWRLIFLAGTSSVLIALLVVRLVPPDSAKSRSADPGRRERIGIASIFSGGLAGTTSLSILVSVTILAGYWGAAYWIPTFLTKERGLSLTDMAGFSLFMYVGMFCGFQFFGMMADRIGRRKSIVAAFVTAAAAIGLYIVVENPVFLFWWGIVVGFTLSGGSGVLGAYYTELFPERIRAYASGVCWNMGRIGAVLAPYTIGYIGKMYGLQTGLAVTCLVFLLGVGAVLLLPETFRKE